MQKLKQQMKKVNFDPKSQWNWDEQQSLEELIINLNEMKTNLQTQITQSMTSHLLGKDRTLNMIQSIIPQLNLDVKLTEPDKKLEGLLENVEVKKRLDVFLLKLGQILQTG